MVAVELLMPSCAVMLEAFTALELVLANTGSAPSFRGIGLGLIVNFIYHSYASTILARKIIWFISEYCIHNKWQAIFLQIIIGVAICVFADEKLEIKDQY